MHYSNYSTEEYTGNEKLYTVLIAIMAVIMSVAISFGISNAIGKKVDRLSGAIRVTENSQFKYAVDTQYVSGIFGTGVTTMNPVTDERLVSAYGAIMDDKEEYTRHSEWVCDTKDKNGSCTSGHTRVWYEWDNSGTVTVMSSTLNFMSKDFSTEQISIIGSNNLSLDATTVTSNYLGRISDNYLYDQDEGWLGGHSVGDTRHSFRYVPLTFVATLYIHSTSDGYMNVDESPCGCSITTETPDQIIEGVKSSQRFYRNVLPFLLPLVVIGIAAYYFSTN